VKNLMPIIVSMLIGTLLVAKVNSETISCDKHPTYCQIIKNRTDAKGNININKTYALQISNLIHNAAKRYDIPSDLYTAILMQESRYALKAKGCHKGLRKLSEIEKEYFLNKCAEEMDIDICKEEIPILIEDKVCADFGMSQIHYQTIKRYSIDFNRLTTDVKYSIEAGAKVLSDFKKRYGHKEKDWWTRYNANNNIKRDIYKQLVERFL